MRTEPVSAHLVDRYLHSMRARGFSPKTIRVYANDISLFSRWFVARTSGTFEPTAVTPALLTAYRDDILASGKKPSTVNRRVQSMKSFCRWAHREGLLEHDAGRDARFVPVVPRRPPEGLTRNEVNALLRAAKASPRGHANRNTAILQVLLQTGVRAGELVRLRAADVRVGDRHAALRVKNDADGSAREIRLNGSVRAALRAYLAERKVSPTGPLFLSERGGHLSVGGLEMVLHSLAARASLNRRINVNQWRHHFALNWLRDHPGDLHGLQRLLGHRRPGTTAIYAPRSEPSDVAAKMELISSNVYTGR